MCRKQFKFLLGKKWCRGCGHAVCRECLTDVILCKNEIESAARVPFTRELFCQFCLFHRLAHWTAVYDESTADLPSGRFTIFSDEPSNYESARSFISSSNELLINLDAGCSKDESLPSLSIMEAEGIDDEDQGRTPKHHSIKPPLQPKGGATTDSIENEL